MGGMGSQYDQVLKSLLYFKKKFYYNRSCLQKMFISSNAVVNTFRFGNNMEKGACHVTFFYFREQVGRTKESV